MKRRRHEEKMKRSSSVVSSTTYRNMVSKVIEDAPTKALDLHGIYEALGKLHDQYKEDSIEVDWRNSVRHCLSINDNFIRVLPEAIQDKFFPNDPYHEFFTRYCDEEKLAPRSYWTTCDIIKELEWKDYIMNTGSNIRKALNSGLVEDEEELRIPNQILAQRRKAAARRPNMPTPGKRAIPRSSSLKGSQDADTVIFEWLDPSHFLDVTEVVDAAPPLTLSPMAVETANQSAIYNIALIEQNERLGRMKKRLESLKVALPIAGPLKNDFFNIQEEREPAILPSPFKADNHNETSPLLISLPPIFNHPL